MAELDETADRTLILVRMREQRRLSFADAPISTHGASEIMRARIARHLVLMTCWVMFGISAGFAQVIIGVGGSAATAADKGVKQGLSAP